MTRGDQSLSGAREPTCVSMEDEPTCMYLEGVPTSFSSLLLLRIHPVQHIQELLSTPSFSAHTHTPNFLFISADTR